MKFFPYLNKIYLIPAILLMPILLTHLGWNLDDSCYWLYRLKNEPFSFFQATGGRYSPLNGLSQQIISYLSFSPIFFFLYNYIVGCFSIIIILKITSNLSYDFRYVPVLIIFLPGFSETYYSFYAGEPTLILFWCILLLCLYNIFLRNTSASISSLLIILTAANIALYHKEPGFIILIVFSVSYLFGYLFSHNKRGSIGEKFIYKFFVLMALLSSGIAYFIQYLFFSLNSFKTGYLTSLTPDWSLTGRLYYSFKALILYIISDPIITVILPLFFILSFFLRRKTKSRNNLSDHNQLYLFYTCLSFSVMCYLGFFLLLGIHAQHYLLPTYPFAIISLTGYLHVFMPMIKKKLKHLYVLVPVVLTALLLVNSLFSSINVAINLKVSSHNFMRYKDALIQKIDNINLIENNRVNFYLPGKKDIGTDASRHIDILKFFDMDMDNIKFEYNSANQNWVEYSSASSTKNLIQIGDLFLITPNSTISQEEIMANLHDLHLRNIFQTQSAYYFEIPEIRHFLKFIMLKKNPNSLVHQMIYREVDFAIYEIL